MKTPAAPSPQGMSRHCGTSVDAQGGEVNRHVNGLGADATPWLSVACTENETEVPPAPDGGVPDRPPSAERPSHDGSDCDCGASAQLYAGDPPTALSDWA